MEIGNSLGWVLSALRAEMKLSRTRVWTLSIIANEDIMISLSFPISFQSNRIGPLKKKICR